MTPIPGAFSNADARSLRAFLESSDRPEGTLQFHELQGFLFVIAASPESISSPQWLPVISNNADFGFRDENEAQQILNGIMSLYNEVNAAVLKRSNALPRGCEFRKDLTANFDENASISQWSRGYLIGHDWLSAVWDEYLPAEMEAECGATAMVLSFFSSKRLAFAFFEEGRPKKRKPEQTFEDFAETMRELFPSALASYAHLGRTIFEVLLQNAATAED